MIIATLSHLPVSSRRTALLRFLREGAAALLLTGLVAGCAGAKPAPASAGHSRALETPLDRYVAAPDPAYAWQAVTNARINGVTVTIIDLTSQSWLTTNEVDRTLWRHWLVVARPDALEHSTALLMIGGGNNKDNRLPKPSDALMQMARQTRSVAAELRMVPNQPLVFGHDGRERVEDDLIAYTWDKFLRTGDDRWPARLPMTKAAVRAMDTVTAFCASPAGGGAKVDTYVVAGGSKRGWTTWTTAVVDKRVVAVCPIVIDLLNIVPSFEHHYRTYGFFAPAVEDYVSAGIMDWMDTSEFKRLMQVVEPFEYRDRLTMPKLIVNASGDQFFLPDSSQFYFDRLPGVKYLRYVPNADHSLKNTDAWETLMAWHHATLNRTPLPRFSWKHEGGDAIRLQTVDQPTEVRLWQATNPAARDFRLDVIGPVWTNQVLRQDDRGAYLGRVASPSQGYTAFFVELTYPLGGPAPLKLTTDVRVTPDTLPHPPYQPKPLKR
ncbi:MAG TPA: PhoPQ-activated pathogenicity-related family protein [Verrucomicrobiota bacterium]|nr:PhoPQ-activated pathogenicity-related family protein [Verrucomicrobiota bacterium]HRZ35417.1 PhoPQ-activated pathogenicity-related family protein [Candidatus Paceibacterota bacterium]HRZ57077.1 PhoPQ-activated pathogenicity-related family protein [Candidatus Paceibacterota bacterium]